MANLEIIGDIIKNIRKSKNLTLQQVSESTGISIGYLSNLERNACSPTLDYIHKVCNCLDITIGELLSETTANNVLVKKNERSVVFDDITKFKFETVSYGKDKMKGIYLTVYPDTLNYYKESQHNRDEIGIIIKGKMDMVLEGKTYSLEEGDSFYIEAGQNHGFINKSDEECISYWVYKI